METIERLPAKKTSSIWILIVYRLFIKIHCVATHWSRYKINFTIKFDEKNKFFSRSIDIGVWHLQQIVVRIFSDVRTKIR